MFPFYRYAKADEPVPTLFPGRSRTGFIYTMNTTDKQLKESGFDKGTLVMKCF